VRAKDKVCKASALVMINQAWFSSSSLSGMMMVVVHRKYLKIKISKNNCYLKEKRKGEKLTCGPRDIVRLLGSFFLKVAVICVVHHKKN
jgi:hypothetical protein